MITYYASLPAAFAPAAFQATGSSGLLDELLFSCLKQTFKDIISPSNSRLPSLLLFVMHRISPVIPSEPAQPTFTQ